ncbi:DUF2252 domain-containing protein [Propioniciclava soli]|uniref:DUF2252 domain-containing protein n=1 Tax=Propioniciclava soli TaxID=2775081 RepID=UPI001E498CE2|nr:DUF2252 family protein [Propioniciclava soli]
MATTDDLDALGALPRRRLDPVEVAAEHHATLLPEFAGLRTARMLESPFACFRGSAAQMASDLARTPSSGTAVISSGDAHLSNFGFHAAPGQAWLFDLKDFDEGGLAPWEWDVKRLVASVVLAVRGSGGCEEVALDAARVTARAYRKTIRRLHQMAPIDRFHQRISERDLERLASTRDQRRRLTSPAARAGAPASAQTLEKFTVSVSGGRHRLVDQRPLARHTDHLALADVERLWKSYLATTREDVRQLLSGHRVVDHVLRLVGVGSVGERCFIVLLEDDHGDPLLLQLRRATPTVLAPWGGVEQRLGALGCPTGDGARVVAAQRVLQAHPDPFLGWVADTTGEHYWRHVRELKGSADLSRLDAEGIAATARVCAALVARAHAQSAGLDAIAEVCARGGKGLDRVFARFAGRYADLVVADHAALVRAAARGALPVADA